MRSYGAIYIEVLSVPGREALTLRPGSRIELGLTSKVPTRVSPLLPPPLTARCPFANTCSGPLLPLPFFNTCSGPFAAAFRRPCAARCPTRVRPPLPSPLADARCRDCACRLLCRPPAPPAPTRRHVLPAARPGPRQVPLPADRRSPLPSAWRFDEQSGLWHQKKNPVTAASTPPAPPHQRDGPTPAQSTRTAISSVAVR